MKKNIAIYSKITLFSFFVVGCLGVILRFIPIYEGKLDINYQNLLQTHSHLAFLGWVFNAIYIITLVQYPEIFNKSKILNHKLMFYLLQFNVILISISLLIWGYKHIAIISLSLHALLTIIIVVKFIRNSDKQKKGTYLLKLAFIMMIISYIGTLFLGPISAMGFKHSDIYYSAIYFYLHFQYNGFFLFAIFAFLINFYHSINIKIILPKIYINLFFISIIFTYSLSLLFANINIIINIITFIFSLSQILIILKLFKINRELIFKYSDKISKYIIISVIYIFFIKLNLQVTAPLLPDFINTNRSLIILFLHLNFLGIVSPILLFFIDIYIIKYYIFRVYILVFILLFLISELFLFLNSFNIINIELMHHINFINSFLMYFLILLFNTSTLKIKLLKKHFYYKLSN